ncbi:MAG: YdeI/OmpD-associated family protein [Gemmatimonadaceae bacterium]|nr:YdeI/OmpD-associated family protein [Gemmatimonadaceae bacterium]
MTVPQFFPSQAAWRRWLAAHHRDTRECIVGFWRLDSKRGGLTYPQALDEALCIGWIDGVRRKHDAESYTVRFTPRKPTSNWSAVNIKRFRELDAATRVKMPGRAAFGDPDDVRATSYSYERTRAELTSVQRAEFKRHAVAWRFFAAQPPWVRRVSAHWVGSAKQEVTRRRRLEQLIAASAAAKRAGPIAGTEARAR